MKLNLFKWDELELMKQDAVRFIRDAKQNKPTKQMIDGFCDYMDFVFCLVYDYGWKDAEGIVGTVHKMNGLDDKTVNLEIKGETFRERVHKAVDALDEGELLNIIDTEMHRDYNAGVYDAGEKSGKRTLKTWNTMNDDKVRDTHSYLEGMSVGHDDKFYTYDGDSARYPGDFSLPENNCHCRCWITLTLE